MFKAQIDALTPETVTFAGARTATTPAAARRGAPSNEELIRQMQSYYGTNQEVIDTLSRTVQKVPPGLVQQLNDRRWTDGDKKPLPLTDQAKKVTAEIKAGIFDPVISKLNADHLFTTMGVGVGIDAQFLVGGAGGVGAAWDVMRREDVGGYAYAMVEMGLRLNLSVNVQGLFVNRLASELTQEVLAMKVSAGAGLGLSLTVFWATPDLKILGFAPGIEIGAGVGATIAYGKIWGFR
ncbi:MAG TPA: hypothetical protein VIG99_13115 [Myxococcaceae bacterium]|jgi:hypothetical protein